MSDVNVVVNCPVDGPVDLDITDIKLFTYDRGRRDYYNFYCGDCEGTYSLPADKWVIRQLRSARVLEVRTFLPIEALDPKREWTIALDEDDYLDFVIELGRSTCLADILD